MPKRRGPFVGKRVLVTRPLGREDGLIEGLEALGASVVHIPTICIAPPRSWKPLDRALAKLAAYDWVVFTSAAGVEAFKSRLGAWKVPGRVAVIGPATAAAVEKAGGRVDRVPRNHRAEALAPALGHVKGSRILFPAAELAGPELKQLLEQAGATVDRVTSYRTLPNDAAARQLKNAATDLDLVVFTSESTALGLRSLLGAAGFRTLFLTARAASIGPVTTAALRRMAIKPAFEARTFTVEGLLAVLRDA